ncbi:hypothetical protein PL9214520245 [Planktothrix tepida PCC 9214]|uniref:Uncharacterized protein n=1 Tax=Planktothrix tepida PCC 9214 TaxID=671072 RepID=A0A1J1LNX6_9CYAN|nr:hypothetical protein PL9214520245 [Planktothrix tepida PCC 9214]
MFRCLLMLLSKVSTPFLPNRSRYLNDQTQALDVQEVSTPFLPNRSRYSKWVTLYEHPDLFQHLFFLIEVATPLEPVINTKLSPLRFQHLFFLIEVATLYKMRSLFFN